MPAVSIIMRSRNDMPLISATLTAIYRQRFHDFELLNVDCTSTDGTAEEIRRWNPQGVVSIRPEDYVPGKVLNAAVARCSGQLVVFNNSDCIPQHEDWLENLITPLQERSADIVYANQLPRPDARPLVRKDYIRAFGDGKIAASWDHFFSLASAAAPRELLMRYPFNEQVQYSEDVEWSYRLKQLHFRIGYVADAVVEHSHNYTGPEVWKRFYNEGKAEYVIFGPRRNFFSGFLRPWLAENCRDFGYLCRHREFAAIPGGIVYRWQQKLAAWCGRRPQPPPNKTQK